MGASGGGPHALAGAALLPDRVTGVVTLAGIAPCTDAFDWFDGMQSPGGLRAAMDGRRGAGPLRRDRGVRPRAVPARRLRGARRADGRRSATTSRAPTEFGPDGLIDDDVAFAKPWGFELDAVRAPVLLVQGEGDRVVPRRHASWMLGRLPKATLWMRLDDGHVSVLDTVPDAMDWLLERAT